MSWPKKGWKRSEESKRNMSIAQKKRFASNPHTEESKRKISIASKKWLDSLTQKEKRLIGTNGLRAMSINHVGEFHKSFIPILTSVGYVPEYLIGKYFVDFAHPESKTIIEIDGPHHQKYSGRLLDRRRDRYTKSKGWRTIRINE